MQASSAHLAIGLVGNLVVMVMVMTMKRHRIDCCCCGRCLATRPRRVGNVATARFILERELMHSSALFCKSTSHRNRNDDCGKGRLECHRAHFASPEFAGRISAPAYAVRQETSRHGGEDHRRRFPDCKQTLDASRAEIKLIKDNI